jgi:hypothetical protein
MRWDLSPHPGLYHEGTMPLSCFKTKLKFQKYKGSTPCEQFNAAELLTKCLLAMVWFSKNHARDSLTIFAMKNRMLEKALYHVCGPSCTKGND